MNDDTIDKFDSYPKKIREKLTYLKDIIIAVSEQNKNIGDIEYAMYFNCKTKLIHMFKELYGDLFKFPGHIKSINHLQYKS